MNAIKPNITTLSSKLVHQSKFVKHTFIYESNLNMMLWTSYGIIPDDFSYQRTIRESINLIAILRSCNDSTMSI